MLSTQSHPPRHKKNFRSANPKTHNGRDRVDTLGPWVGTFPHLATRGYATGLVMTSPGEYFLEMTVTYVHELSVDINADDLE